MIQAIRKVNSMFLVFGDWIWANGCMCMIVEFEYLSNKLYTAEMKTYLTDRIQGDSETCYAHTLCWYFPAILRQTYNRNSLGLGA